MINHQNIFSTNLTSDTLAGATTSPLNSIPTIDAPFYIAWDAGNANGHFEVKQVTSKTATNVNHSALSYAHTTSEEIRMVVPAEELDVYANFYEGVSRQAIINGGFTVNQRAYVSNATLAAGAYGHDRWKAGASGGDYTFTQLAQSTQITIKTGKSLIQVVEDKNVVGGTYTLSWTGTAQARFGKDSATPSGAYASSPITITGQTAGTVMSVEFNEGTLKDVQLNVGSFALPFQPKSFGEEDRACKRFFTTLSRALGIADNTTDITCNFFTEVQMRATPVPTLSSGTNFLLRPGVAYYNATSPQIVTMVNNCIGIKVISSGLTASAVYSVVNGVYLDSEL